MGIKDFVLLFKQEAKFIAGATTISQVPNINLPEIAFIGRSNVGKSSLINTICNNRKLAKVSCTPGRTRQINFFNVGDKLILVDLPGYGFAEVSLNTRILWEKLIKYYLQNRTNLKLVNLLVDARRGIKDTEKKIMQILATYNKNFQIIFTKIDKVNNANQVSTINKDIFETLPSNCNLFYVSNKSKKSARKLQVSFEKFI